MTDRRGFRCPSRPMASIGPVIRVVGRGLDRIAAVGNDLVPPAERVRLGAVIRVGIRRDIAGIGRPPAVEFLRLARWDTSMTRRQSDDAPVMLGVALALPLPALAGFGLGRPERQDPAEG